MNIYYESENENFILVVGHERHNIGNAVAICYDACPDGHNILLKHGEAATVQEVYQLHRNLPGNNISLLIISPASPNLAKLVNQCIDNINGLDAVLEEISNIAKITHTFQQR